VSDPSLASRLQAVLGDAYAVERELTGGGMSRLFVATEASLKRRVVVKVLPPELASEVSAARFKQEIEVAAQLQHPHVLPILSAASADGLLYYIMPFVSGESLRHHLTAVGRMPVDDSVRILREVADALAFAHRTGVVHRDIKPENILLEEGHAVLTDFGVARAISAARSGTITGTGLAVGTPRYMSPEQAAGDKNVDARADVYALALVGYEMLAGKLPFDGATPQVTLAAQLTQTPPAVTKERPDAPAQLSDALARALAKSPDERFASAADFRDALEPRVPTAAMPARRWQGIAVLGVTAALIVGGWLLARGKRSPVLEGNTLAVAPFDVVDPDLQLWREGLVDILSRNLDGAGSLRTVPPSVVIKRFSGRSDAPSAAELGRATGAKYALFGRLLHAGPDTLRMSVSVLDAGSGRVLGEIERRDSPSRVDRLADSATVAVLRVLGEAKRTAPGELASVGTTSLPALKAFLQGEQYFRRSAWDSAAVWYRRAVETDTTFALAWWRLGLTAEWARGAADSLGELYQLRAGGYNHGLAPRDSILVESDSITAALYYHGRRDGRLASRLLRTLGQGVAKYPNDPQMWYEFADAQYHDATGRGIGVQPRDVLASFDKSIALDSSFAPAYIHSIQLGFRLGGSALARRYIRAYLALQPSDVSAEGIRLLDQLSDPSTAASAETRRSLDQAAIEELSWAALMSGSWVDSGETSVRLRRVALERVRSQPSAGGDSAYHRDNLANALARRGHITEALGYGWGVQWSAPLAAMLGAIPTAQADSIAVAMYAKDYGCVPCVLAYYASRGDSDLTRRIVAEGDTTLRIDTSAFIRSLASAIRPMTRGYDALARHDTTQAIRYLEQVADSACHYCAYVDLSLAELYAARGRDKEALAVLDAVSGTDWTFYAVAVTLERARVLERLRNTARAIDEYTYVADSWQHADPSLQPYVAEARTALKRLGSDVPRGTPIAHKP